VKPTVPPVFQDWAGPCSQKTPTLNDLVLNSGDPHSTVTRRRTLRRPCEQLHLGSARKDYGILACVLCSGLPLQTVVSVNCRLPVDYDYKT
jgi:hypothetical protein